MDAFAALADPTRRNILELLSVRGQLAATDIFRQFALTAPAVSQHLKALRQAELVTVEKRAQQRLYRVNAVTLKTVELWAAQTARQWNGRLDKLEQALEQELNKEAEHGRDA